MLKGLEVKFGIKPLFISNLALVLICLLSLSSCGSEGPMVSEGHLNINGSEIYYKTIGKGEPLVIVHGGPVLDHSYLLPHLKSLADNFQLIFYDQRASGRSSVLIDSSKMNLAAFVEDIELLRKELGLKKINLMGHSWGGLLAMGYAIKYSENIDHLVLSNSMAPNVSDWQEESAVVAKLQTEQDRVDRQEILDALKDKNKVRLIFIEELLMASFKPQMFDRENLSKLALYIPDDYEQRSRIYQLLKPDIMSFNFDADLIKISCPTLIIYGEMEPAVEIYADKMVDLIPNANLAVINKSGHFPFIEQKGAFDKIVLRFLRK